MTSMFGHIRSAAHQTTLSSLISLTKEAESASRLISIFGLPATENGADWIDDDTRDKPLSLIWF
jgi:hypothetical protein